MTRLNKESGSSLRPSSRPLDVNSNKTLIVKLSINTTNVTK